MQYLFNESEHQLRKNVRFNWDANCFIYLEHFLSDFDDLFFFPFVLFHTCSIIFLLLSQQFMNIFRETRLWSLRRLISWFVIRSSAAAETKADLIAKWEISRRTSFRDSWIWLCECIYSHILIFKVKSFSSSIHRWKLFEMRINIMILKEILSSFIVEEKNSIFKN